MSNGNIITNNHKSLISCYSSYDINKSNLRTSVGSGKARYNHQLVSESPQKRGKISRNSNGKPKNPKYIVLTNSKYG